jgi:hypothetical protein
MFESLLIAISMIILALLTLAHLPISHIIPSYFSCLRLSTSSAFSMILMTTAVAS